MKILLEPEREDMTVVKTDPTKQEGERGSERRTFLGVGFLEYLVKNQALLSHCLAENTPHRIKEPLKKSGTFCIFEVKWYMETWGLYISEEYMSEQKVYGTSFGMQPGSAEIFFAHSDEILVRLKSKIHLATLKGKQLQEEFEFPRNKKPRTVINKRNIEQADQFFNLLLTSHGANPHPLTMRSFLIMSPIDSWDDARMVTFDKEKSKRLLKTMEVRVDAYMKAKKGGIMFEGGQEKNSPPAPSKSSESASVPPLVLHRISTKIDTKILVFWDLLDLIKTVYKVGFWVKANNFLKRNCWKARKDCPLYPKCSDGNAAVCCIPCNNVWKENCKGDFLDLKNYTSEAIARVVCITLDECGLHVEWPRVFTISFVISSFMLERKEEIFSEMTRAGRLTLYKSPACDKDQDSIRRTLDAYQNFGTVFRRAEFEEAEAKKRKGRSALIEKLKAQTYNIDN